MDFRIVGGRALIGDRLEETTIHVNAVDGSIASIGADAGGAASLDADGLLVLPGIIDIHGDAFERQVMPRPGVEFSLDIALIDSDRQVIANGITTVFHGVTWSWEPGLRGTDNARGILAAIERLQARLAADTRFHLRHETFNFAAENEVIDWITKRRIHAVAFNDHLPRPETVSHRPDKLDLMVQRSGLTRENFVALVDDLRGQQDSVPSAIRRIAAAANAHGVPVLSHDDASPDERRWFRDLGCRVSEFPMNLETACEAAKAGDDIVLGAPNVVRGKSHLGWLNATQMIADQRCTILASDYYYPAQLTAAFRLADTGVMPIEKAWRLIAEAPARAMGLTDRGRIEGGLRADLVLIDAASRPPHVLGVIAAGRIVHLTDARRITNGHRLNPARTRTRGKAELLQ
jgi:alpha-D-ribose 1-methylphosphonate 5-triphosphate diphosphatase